MVEEQENHDRRDNCGGRVAVCDNCADCGVDLMDE